MDTNSAKDRSMNVHILVTRILHVTWAAIMIGWLVGQEIATAQQPTVAIQVKSEELLENRIVRQSVLFPGWDPYEPVPAYVYLKEKSEKLPVIVFIHGMGADKTYLASWHAELAARGFAVISIDAHLSGDRRIATTIGGIKAEQDWVWPHQTVVNHTANDVSKILDVLPSRREFDPTRVAVTGFSMGGATTMVLAWRERRISAVMPLCGCVDFWWDVTKIEPGAEQDAKIAEFSPRLKQLTSSLDSNTPERMDAIVPKALFLINGTQDRGIDIRSIRKFADQMRPRYDRLPDRFDFFEDEQAGHTFSEVMKEKSTEWLVRHLMERPIRVSRPHERTIE
jgi:pimeloyl-ACP methyl ester carboxylesterase